MRNMVFLLNDMGLRCILHTRIAYITYTHRLMHDRDCCGSFVSSRGLVVSTASQFSSKLTTSAVLDCKVMYVILLYVLLWESH